MFSWPDFGLYGFKFMITQILEVTVYPATKNVHFLMDRKENKRKDGLERHYGSVLWTNESIFLVIDLG